MKRLGLLLPLVVVSVASPVHAAEGPRQEGEVHCTGGYLYEYASYSGGAARFALPPDATVEPTTPGDPDSVACGVTVGPGGSVVMRLYGWQDGEQRSGTVEVVGDQPQPSESVGGTVPTGQEGTKLLWTSDPLASGTSSAVLVAATGYISVDYFTLEGAGAPSPSPSPSPSAVASGQACGSEQDPCVITTVAGAGVGLSDEQEYALWLFLGTLLLLSLTGFLLRNGRALRV